MLTTIKKSTFIFFTMCLLICANSYATDIKVLEKMFRDQEFEKLITTLDEIGEDNFTAKQYRIFVYALSTQDLDDAEEAAERAISKYNNDPDMFVMHASIMGSQAQDSIFSALGYAEKALDSLNRAVEIAPNNPEYLSALMSFYIAAPSIAGGDMDKAKSIANDIAKIDTLDGILAIARYHLANDEPKQALMGLNDGLQKFPDSIQIYSVMARVNIDLDQISEAIANYERATKIQFAPLSDEDKTDEAMNEEWQSNQYRYLNSHYQIGRLALQNKTELEKGIAHLKTYIEKYASTDIDVSSLPSVSWAKLRLSALYLEDNAPKLADEIFKQVTLENNDSMKKIYKKLQKRIKRAL